MCSVGQTAHVVKEMRRYSLDMLAISKCRWYGSRWLKKKAVFPLEKGPDDDGDIYKSDIVILTSENTAAASFWDSPYHLSVKDET